MKSASTSTGISLALVCLALLATMPVISNARPDGFSALSFAFYLSLWQLVFATPLFIWELRGPNRGLFSSELTRPARRRAFSVSIFTGILFGLSIYLYVLSIQKAGAANAAIAIQAYPLFAILWETLFLKRKKTLPELALTAVLILALAYLGTGGTGRISGLSVWFVAALGVPFLWSIAHVIIKEELAETPVTPAQVTFLRVWVSAAFLAIIMAIAEPTGFAAAALRSDYQTFAITMGLVYYLELLIWFYAVRHIDVSLASTITTPWPAFTMVLAAIVLGDKIEVYQIVTFLIVVLCINGLMLASLRKTRENS